jgi:hypothetical protein
MVEMRNSNMADCCWLLFGDLSSIQNGLLLLFYSGG